jgi:glucosamine 6-phosphate synthetase-like amidotransferase/phosphosugar isomerase protein
MRVHKAVGRVDELSEQMSGMNGTHGIAHLRLATESRIDPAHAQPFWGRPYADIAVTHNGHITNYHKLRQKFEARGFGFASHNDSEIIGVYLGEKMEEGASLSDALKIAALELDGSFSFIVATANALAWRAIHSRPSRCCMSKPKTSWRWRPSRRRFIAYSEKACAFREIKPRETRVWELA